MLATGDPRPTAQRRGIQAGLRCSNSSGRLDGRQSLPKGRAIAIGVSERFGTACWRDDAVCFVDGSCRRPAPAKEACACEPGTKRTDPRVQPSSDLLIVEGPRRAATRLKPDRPGKPAWVRSQSLKVRCRESRQHRRDRWAAFANASDQRDASSRRTFGPRVRDHQPQRSRAGQ